MKRINPGPCAKQTVTATLITLEGQRFVGTNYCLVKQKTCPRNEQGFQPGEGYHLCKDVCRQPGHAEEIAIAKAHADGVHVTGATVYVEGHPIAYAQTGSGVCPNCAKLLTRLGVSSVIGAPPK